MNKNNVFHKVSIIIYIYVYIYIYILMYDVNNSKKAIRTQFETNKMTK